MHSGIVFVVLNQDKLFDKVVQLSSNVFRFPFSLSFINFTTLYHLNGFIKNVKLVIAGVIL